MDRYISALTLSPLVTPLLANLGFTRKIDRQMD